MKAIGCEMCGSGSIIKKEGLFVCEHCGCKYSPEEAKGLLTEVKVKGSVRVEGISTADQLLAKGDTYLRLEDYKAAAETFEQFIEQYPERAVGYERYVNAVTKYFRVPDGISPGKLDEMLSKYKKLTADKPTDKTRRFVGWAETCIEYFDVRDKLAELEKTLRWVENSLRTSSLQSSKFRKMFVFVALIVAALFAYMIYMFAIGFNLLLEAPVLFFITIIFNVFMICVFYSIASDCTKQKAADEKTLETVSNNIKQLTEKRDILSRRLASEANRSTKESETGEKINEY